MICTRPLATFSLLMLMVVPERFFAQNAEPQDNFAIFQRLFDNVAERVTDRLAADHARPLVVAPAMEPTSALAALRARIVKTAIDKGYKVFGADSLLANQQFVRIDLRFVNSTIDYTQVQNSFLWRRGMVQRQALVEVNAEVVEQPTSRILVQEFFKADFADTVRASALSKLEDPQHGFTVGRAPRRTFWARITEPLLLTVSTGAALYALYALRSR